MAVNSLCTALRRVVYRKGLAGFSNCNLTASYSTRAATTPQNVMPLLAQRKCTDTPDNIIDIRINFVPRTLNIDFGLPVPNGSKRSIVDFPILKIPTLDRISPRLPVLDDVPEASKSLDLPPGEVIEKQAHRMIVIRRRKMRKHIRQKLRKKNRAEWTKLKQKREIRRERAFLAEMEAQLTKAQQFSVPEYINERIALYKKKLTPKTYRGEILPESVIKKFLHQDEIKKKRRKPRLTL